MGLKPFDNIWYCDKCKEQFEDFEDDFIYCPYCGNVLKNEWYQGQLQSIKNFLKNSQVSICEECGEEFDTTYNFCPLCSNELKKESSLIRVEKDNSITVDWNGEETRVFDKETFLSSPHFSGNTVLKCFKNKNMIDYKLESDFKTFNLKPPKKLNFKESYSIAYLENHYIIGGIVFVPELNNEILSDEKFNAKNKVNHISSKCMLLKVRENLYAKLKVLGVIEY